MDFDVIWNMNPELYYEGITSLQQEETQIQRQNLWDYCCLETKSFPVRTQHDKLSTLVM